MKTKPKYSKYYYGPKSGMLKPHYRYENGDLIQDFRNVQRRVKTANKTTLETKVDH